MGGTLTAGVTGALGCARSSPSSQLVRTRAKGPTPAAKIKMDLRPEAGPPTSLAPTSSRRRPGPEDRQQHEAEADRSAHFSLIEEGSIPTTSKETKECGKARAPRLRERVQRAQRLRTSSSSRKRNVDKGLDGWDTSFNDEVKGDSWFTDVKRESEDSRSQPLSRRLDALLLLPGPSRRCRARSSVTSSHVDGRRRRATFSPSPVRTRSRIGRGRAGTAGVAAPGGRLSARRSRRLAASSPTRASSRSRAS